MTVAPDSTCRRLKPAAMGEVCSQQLQREKYGRRPLGAPIADLPEL
jgi:hypothetical protein